MVLESAVTALTTLKAQLNNFQPKSSSELGGGGVNNFKRKKEMHTRKTINGKRLYSLEETVQV